MTHESNNHKDEEDDTGSLRVNGPFGTGVRIPESLVEAIKPTFARWIVPAVAIAIGVCAIAWGVSQVIHAMRGATP